MRATAASVPLELTTTDPACEPLGSAIVATVAFELREITRNASPASSVTRAVLLAGFTAMELISAPRGMFSPTIIPEPQPGIPCIIAVVGRTLMKVTLLVCPFEVTMTGTRPTPAIPAGSIMLIC